MNSSIAPAIAGGHTDIPPVRLVQPIPKPPLSSVGSGDRGCAGAGRAGGRAPPNQLRTLSGQVPGKVLFISNMVTLSLPKTLLAGTVMTNAAWAFRGFRI